MIHRGAPENGEEARAIVEARARALSIMDEIECAR
jgi:hypothetical protein